MIRFLALIFIRFYQYCLSPVLGPSCRFSPTCSSYAYSCIEEFGLPRGSILALRRLCRCHPWGESGYDPPPTRDGNATFTRAKKENRLWIGKS